MTIFCIQVQPDRAPGLDIGRVRGLCVQLASDKALIERHGVIEGDDGGPYLNLMFETPDAAKFWKMVETKIYGDHVVGGPMSQASLATCTGEHGWDDYLLLHHYDQGLQLDSLSDR
jgi:hypothetical protein